MLIHVHDNLQVRDLKYRFEKCFQSLKIEFYSKAPNKPSGYSEPPIDDLQRIGDIRQKHEEGDLVIKSWYSVQQVEDDFRQIFGLHIEIFRKENNRWMSASKTSQYNLRQQSEMSQHSESLVAPQLKEPLDEYEYL
jgi:hypothetical protein